MSPEDKDKDEYQTGAVIKAPDGEIVIVTVTGDDDEPCDVEVDAPDDYTVKRF